MKTTILAASCALFLGGLTTADTINVPGDYASIGQAIDNAQTGDVVLVAAGLYQENQVATFNEGSGVTLSGETNKDGTPAVTFLLPTNNDRTIHVASNADGAIIENINFEGNGNSTTASGSSIYVNQADGTTIHNCVFRDNMSDGGAVHVDQSINVTISECTFENNQSTSHSGALLINTHSSAQISECTFTNNFAADVGGVCRLYNYHGVEFSDCVMTGNVAYQRGGAIYATSNQTNHSTNVVLNNTIISGNTANYGGGIYLVYGSVTGGEVFGNSAEYGGGVYFEDYNASIVGMTIRDNVAVVNGGGVYTSYGVEEYPDVIASTICGNTPNQVWHIEGDATNIINESCSSNPAACCVNGACIMVEPLMCGDVGGTLSNGGEEDCSSTECAEPCLGDVNNDSEINVNDLLTVIANWGGCP